MQWIKNIVWDLVVTVVVIVGVWFDYTVLYWIIAAYTALMVVTKALTAFTESWNQIIRKARNNTPDVVIHLIYAINLAILLYGKWWIVAGGWALVWLFSWLAQRRMSQKVTG